MRIHLSSRASMRRLIFSSAAAGALAIASAACGGGSIGARGQTSMIDRTTAGQNRCTVAKSHDRPFVVEWDATDLASFEAKTGSGIVFVKYAGCEMTVLDCGDASARGKYGAYRAAEPTSGNVESIDMKSEGELYAELPLGAAALAGRIERGEELHLRYFVSGITTAARDAVWESELAAQAECKGATHFVQSYSLGAFELTSSERGAESTKVGVKGIGAGGSHAREQSSLKHGGDIASCRAGAQDGRIPSTCRVPIRLALRAVTPGAPPASAPTSASSSSSPGNTNDAMSRALEAGKYRNAAAQKLQDGDAAGCLRDLDKGRDIDPDPEHERFNDATRAHCTMKLGRCDEGRALLRKYLLGMYGKSMTEDAVDAQLEVIVPAQCKKPKK